jgi:predicted small secreted protein
MPTALKISLISLLLLSSFGLAACNTISGMGEDVGAAGDAMSDTAEETKEKM